METVTYIATSRQMALKNKVDVIANNIANMSTTGYKRQRMIFEEFLVKPHQTNPLHPSTRNNTMVQVAPGRLLYMYDYGYRRPDGDVGVPHAVEGCFVDVSTAG